MVKLIVAIALITIIVASLGMLIFDSIHTRYSRCSNNAESQREPQPKSSVDLNGFVIVIGISIGILVLPFVNKLKIGDVEIEFESCGYMPAGPAAATAGLDDKTSIGIAVEFLFCPILVLRTTFITIYRKHQLRIKKV